MQAQCSDETLPKDTPIMPGSLGKSGSALAVSQETNCDNLLLRLAPVDNAKPSACTSMDRVWIEFGRQD